MRTLGTPRTRATSSAATANSSSADTPWATSVATRRSDACSSARRRRLSRASPVVMARDSNTAGAPEGRPGRKLSASVSGNRVVVADDDVLVREGISSMLTRHGFEVVGEAGDGAGLDAVVRDHLPDLVIVDIRMPPT